MMLVNTLAQGARKIARAKYRNRNISVSMHALIFGYILAILGDEVVINGLKASLLTTLAVSGVLSYVFTYKLLNIILKALIIVGITVLSIAVSLKLNDTAMTIELLKNQILPQTTLIIVLSLKLAFCIQIVALISEPYLPKPLRTIKATDNELLFAEILILGLVIFCIEDYLSGASRYLAITLYVLKGYIIIKLFTILQTKAMLAIEVRRK